MILRRGWFVWCSLLGFLLLASAPACGSPEDPPTTPPPTTSPPTTTPPAEPPSAAEMEQLCHDWADVGCRKNMECASIDGTLEECIAHDQADCLTEIQGQSTSCQIAHGRAIERCDDELEAETCSDYCGSSGFCFFYCPYICS